MSYAVVMAALDLDSSPGGVLNASARISEIFGARALGVAAAECTISPYYAEGPVAEKFIAANQAELRTQLNSLEKQFHEVHAGRRDKVEFRSAERLPDGVMIAAARGADLVVVARPSESANLMHGPDVGNLMMQAGRPVLVVPGDAAQFSADQILIAWKDTREARRAVHDALPLLSKAREVHLLAVHEPEASDATTLSGADDVVNWLARHDVKAVATARPDHGSVGKSIEQFADDIGADLIVAGAFGHSRFMEWLLGGVTRHLLRVSKRSVLFSH
jgi:nucleotide-binding universal stress UspA family protein